METQSRLEIEAALCEDKTGVFKAQLVQEFRNNAQNIRNEMNKGLAPGEYEKLNKLATSIDTACVLVEQLWVALQQECQPAGA